MRSWGRVYVTTIIYYGISDQGLPCIVKQPLIKDAIDIVKLYLQNVNLQVKKVIFCWFLSSSTLM